MNERELMRQLREIPVDVPSPEEARRLENQLFVRAQLTPQRRERSPLVGPTRVIGLIAASVLVMLVAGYAMWERQLNVAVDAQLGLVRATKDASFVQELSVLGSFREELVELEDGTLFVSVRKLGPGDRFVIRCGDSEVEVRGTRFEVSAVRGQLVHVAVEEGVVEVRPGFERARMLLPGDEWSRGRAARATRWVRAVGDTRPASLPTLPRVTNARDGLEIEDRTETSPKTSSVLEPTSQNEEVEVVVEVSEVPKRSKQDNARNTSVTKPTLPRQEVESAFLRAWQFHKRGSFEDAAELFLFVIESGDESDIVEDAAYWRVFALEAAGQRADAISAAKGFLDRFPAASRRASMELRWAWLLLADGRRGEARAMFEKLAGSGSEPVRAEAKTGLERLESMDRED